jgi:hypothetical protein
MEQKMNSKFIKGSEASGINFMSFVEFQSMENTVRKSHIEALHKMKDFWYFIITV